jgi:hypothetical protein
MDKPVISIAECIALLRRFISDSTLGKRSIENWYIRMTVQYRRLTEKLPDGHPWKSGAFGKLRIAEENAKKISILGPFLGLNDVETKLFEFLLLSQNVGRLVEAQRDEEEADNPSSDRLVPHPGATAEHKHHGYESAAIIHDILKWDVSPGLRQVILYAIKHHADPRMPEECDFMASEETMAAAIGLLCILRCWDKRKGFLKAQLLVSDEACKCMERRTNWCLARKKDPTWGEEKRCIAPERLFTTFAQGGLIVRPDCESYEAFILQILTYLFDVMHPEFLELILSEGGPSILYRYLERQLAEQPHQLDAIRARLTAWNPDAAERIMSAA